MGNRKAVTISVTPDEYDSICTAFEDYLSKCESTDDCDFIENANRDGDNFETFQTKYKRAHQRQLVKSAVKKALEYAKGTEHD
ncbi:hypothetical protein A9G07_05015 [Gilliamella sp. wkB72]|nr:hypothetical protein [Gilliamella apicola]OCL24201.1 hypothetical protein A9G07_05015 [Gilliamella apicola]